MSFFGKRKQVIIENSKSLTEPDSPVTYLTPKTVAIPLNYMESENFDIHVKVGDSVKIGTKIAAGADDINLYSTVSGKVTAIEKRDHISLKKIDHIIIKNDFLDEKELLIEPVSDLSVLIKDNIINSPCCAFGIDKECFTKNTNTVLLNAICEPYITSVEAHMLQDTDLLFARYGFTF